MFHRSPKRKYKPVENSPSVKESRGMTASGGGNTFPNRFSVTKWIQCGRSISSVFEEDSIGRLDEVDLNRPQPTDYHHETGMAWTESTSTGETSQTSYYSDEEDEILDSSYDRYFDEVGSYDFTDMQQLLKSATTSVADYSLSVTSHKTQPNTTANTKSQSIQTPSSNASRLTDNSATHQNRTLVNSKSYNMPCRATLTKAASAQSSRRQPAKEKKREWRAAVDPKSGRTYYYDAQTRETQWRKPLELATDSERNALMAKEQKQRDFFQSMEANILQCMQTGQVPGTSSSSSCVSLEDRVKPLPIQDEGGVGASKTISKPKLLRTISSMDSNILEELTRNCPSISPDSVATHFKDITELFPLPGERRRQQSSHADSCPPKGVMSLRQSIQSHHTLESRDENMVQKSRCEESIPKPSLSKRNSCGTLYIQNTMAAPDKEAAIKCVSGIYRTHLVQTAKEQSTISASLKFEEYEIFNDDYSSNKRRHPLRDGTNYLENWRNEARENNHSPATVLVESESAIETLMEKNSVPLSRRKRIPSLEEITYFFRFIFNKAQMESDCIIMSLIYVERLLRTTNGGVRPTVENWRSLLFSCMVMASKVWDDMSMWNADFSQACPVGVVFTVQRINELELAMLTVLKYNVKVLASEYAKYYFLTRSMMIRSGLASQDIVTSSPLDIEGAKKLEFQSTNYKAMCKPVSLVNRSKSVGEAEGTSILKSASESVSLEQVVKM